MTYSASLKELFSRNIGTFTTSQQNKLHNAAVTVIGCGGLGGYVIEELARTGIGQLNICDPDVFSASNSNRQLHCRIETQGQNKAVATQEQIEKIHRATAITTFDGEFQAAQPPFFDQEDVVVDCLDNILSRQQLATLCAKKNIPLVHGAVAGWYGQVAVQTGNTNLMDTLYSKSHAQKTTVSVIACSVAVVASLQVAEICKLLLEIPSPLRDNWMSIDLQRMTFDILHIK